MLSNSPRLAGHCVSVFLVSVIYGGAANGADRDEPPWHQRLRVGHWTKIHAQQHGDTIHFVRQRHGGSAFDTRRNRLILFGSDTHGHDWSNSPLFFNTKTLTWSRAYADDPPDSYAVTRDGIPVAGPKGDHPWTMHTFAAVTYDARRDELIVASYPEHLKPGRFTDVMARLWTQIRRHPTWIYQLTSKTWQSLTSEAVHFSPYATAYDTHRAVVIGYRTDGIYELDGEPRRWRKITGPGLLGYHNNAVYDTTNRALVVFGSNEHSNDLIIYRPETGAHQRMPTTGLRPPRTQHAPMAFHAKMGKTVVLVSSEAVNNETETWLYDLAADRWIRMPGATLPLKLGMNYNLVYAPEEDLLLLVTGNDRQPTSVWALRL